MRRKFLFPMVALMALGVVGCGNQDEEKPTKTINPTAEPEDSVVELEDLGLVYEQELEFTDLNTMTTYRVHEGAPEDGGEYIFGFYNQTLGKNYFFHGGPHTDSAAVGLSDYDFFLGCAEDDASCAALIKTDYVDATHFTMQVVPETGDGYTYHFSNGSEKYIEGNYYDGKYLQFEPTFNATKNYNTTSLRFVDKADVNAGGTFTFRYQIDGVTIYSPCSWMQNAEDEIDPELEYKGFGTYGTYVSIGCIAQSKMTAEAQYIARLWEVVEE